MMVMTNVKASCHKHFVVVSHDKQMPLLTAHRLVSSTCHGLPQLCVLNLAVEPFTARNKARHLFIAIVPTPPAFDAPVRGVPVGILP